MMSETRMNYAIQQRLRLIDFLLCQYGSINRSALTDYFGISVPQASLDLREYQRIAPANTVYDLQAKTYRRKAGFIRVYP